MHLLKFLHRFRRSPNKVKGSAGSTTLGDEIRRLASTLADSNERKGFESEMQGFKEIFDRYVGEKNRGDIDWSKVTAARADIVSYDSLLQGADNETLRKLAVLKVNGGLGTSMGLTGAKSVLEVQDGLTFLDLIVQQIQHINISRGVDIPLILMTSFGTHEDTIRIIKNRQHIPMYFVLKMLERRTKSAWYPPGHGDLYKSLYMSGVLDSLLSEGKEYLFVSNADNLAATVDAKLLQHMIDTQSEFLMEVVDKTKADIQGGTLVDYAGSIQLLELAQVPQDHLDEFSSARKFSTFNTNNLWIDLKAIRRVMGNGGMLLPIIETVKTLDDGRTVVQLETAAGSAIKHFRNAHGVHVPRARFLPVKDCSDLLMVRSDLYKVINGQLIFNDKRMFKTTPIVKLGDQFRNIDSFQRRFKTIPSLVDLDHLTVAGDVSFGRSVTLRGTVVVAANEGQTIEVPDGSLLENKLVAGALNMTRL